MAVTYITTRHDMKVFIAKLTHSAQTVKLLLNHGATSHPLFVVGVTASSGGKRLLTLEGKKLS